MDVMEVALFQCQVNWLIPVGPSVVVTGMLFILTIAKGNRWYKKNSNDPEAKFPFQPSNQMLALETTNRILEPRLVCITTLQRSIILCEYLDRSFLTPSQILHSSLQPLLKHVQSWLNPKIHQYTYQLLLTPPAMKPLKSRRRLCVFHLHLHPRIKTLFCWR